MALSGDTDIISYPGDDDMSSDSAMENGKR